VRKAEKEGLASTVGGAELLAGFYSVFAENMRDLGTPVYPRDLFVRTLEQFPDARVFVVRLGDKTVAGAVALRFRDTVLVPWASSLRAYRSRCPNMLLYWTMLKTAVEDGAARFDFGRSSPDAGTHQFKLQWGARETPLHWEYSLLGGATIPDQGPSNSRFHLAIDLWRRMPLIVANSIGPRLVRHIP
jgi:serine/alanine adding enzyme